MIETKAISWPFLLLEKDHKKVYSVGTDIPIRLFGEGFFCVLKWINAFMDHTFLKIVESVKGKEKMTKKEIVKAIIACFKRGNKLMVIGNGGSAAMAQHMAAEFVCKFEHNREPLPAIALTTDTSALTAIGNDYGFDHVFSRQVTALRKPGDILLLLSTSGKSENILVAKNRAELWKELIVIDFPRKGTSTAKIQEYQFQLMHDVCREVEKAFL